jgi:hypothetical protein
MHAHMIDWLGLGGDHQPRRRRQARSGGSGHHAQSGLSVSQSLVRKNKKKAASDRRRSGRSREKTSRSGNKHFTTQRAKGISKLNGNGNEYQVVQASEALFWAHTGAVWK